MRSLKQIFKKKGFFMLICFYIFLDNPDWIKIIHKLENPIFCFE